MRTFVLRALMVVLLLPSTSKASGKTLRFNGAISSSDELGMTVGANEKKTMIAVLRPQYRYALILPYAKDWEFSSDGGVSLRGHAGRINLTLSAFETKTSPAVYLGEVRARLERTKRATGITKMEVVSYEGQQVLRNEVSGAAHSADLNGATVVHYFGAKTARGVLYELHLSVVVPPQEREAFKNEPWLWCVAKGFAVGEAAEARWR